MNIFIAPDRQHYRRWINAGVTVLLPGSGHYLAGRRAAGLGWFLAAFFIRLLIIWMYMHPRSGQVLGTFGLCDVVGLVFLFAVCGDACRRPIPRIGFKGWSLFLTVALTIVLGPYVVVRTYFFQPFRVPTGGMEPTLLGPRSMPQGVVLEGDRFFVNRFIYRTSRPQRGDIVVFRSNGVQDPQIQRNSLYVKRIVGLPGERVSLEPPFVLINGQRLQDPPIFKTIAQSQRGYAGYAFGQKLANARHSVTLGNDEYFVLGDNTRNSMDSRYYGPITRRCILGKVFYRYAPAHRKGRVNHTE